MDETRGYRVTGRVQGVGFRWWTQRTASRLGLRGDVRNRPDGSVELVACGDPGSLEALEEALAHGPSLARVESVERITPGSEVPRKGFLMEGR